MSRLPLLFVLCAIGVLPAKRADAAAQAVPQVPPVPPIEERIADLRVHGNQIATDDEVITLSGVKVGDVVEAKTIDEIAGRLRASHKFQKVDVLKRFASIEDASQIVIVMIVDEGPVTIVPSSTPGGAATMKRRRGLSNVMFLPILDSEDGYGLTYGAEFAFPKVGGSRGRLSFPASWGGERKIGAEFEKGFESRVITRMQFGGALAQRTNPYFEEDDTRNRVWARAERATGPLRIGATGGWEHVDFHQDTNVFRSIGADVTLDTRREPFLARNAVYASATIDRLFFDKVPAIATFVGTAHPPINRHTYEARGYIGFIGQSVVVLRVLREDSTAPLPSYLKPLLGGVSNLRGFDAGTAIGDTLAAGSAELRLPLTTPVKVAKIGVSVFADTGATCAYGQRLADQPRLTGVGGAVWTTAAVFHMSLSVAHGLGAHTRVQFAVGLGF